MILIFLLLLIIIIISAYIYGKLGSDDFNYIDDNIIIDKSAKYDILEGYETIDDYNFDKYTGKKVEEMKEEIKNMMIKNGIEVKDKKKYVTIHASQCLGDFLKNTNNKYYITVTTLNISAFLSIYNEEIFTESCKFYNKSISHAYSDKNKNLIIVNNKKEYNDLLLRYIIQSQYNIICILSKKDPIYKQLLVLNYKFKFYDIVDEMREVYKTMKSGLEDFIDNYRKSNFYGEPKDIKSIKFDIYELLKALHNIETSFMMIFIDSELHDLLVPLESDNKLIKATS